MKAVFCLTLLGIVAASQLEAAHPAAVPRSVLALYDSTYEKDLRYGPVHQLAEMPLNHLGLTVTYQDVNAALPALSEMKDVRGVLTWFQSDAMADPPGFLRWAESVIDSGIPVVVFGYLSANRDFQNRVTSRSLVDRFWARLGLRSDHEWVRITYDFEIAHKVSSMVEFERPLTGVLPAFEPMRKIDKQVHSYLSVHRPGDPNTESHLVLLGPHGGYVADGYTHYYSAETNKRQWYIQPFEFFRIAFRTDDLPKPDTTTVSGRRIFYSQVDGDGWRNVSEIPKHKRAGETSAEVILREVIQRFPNLPVTVAPIVADLDPAWSGNSKSLRLAKEIFALPNVEAGSHTYSHPLDWEALGRLFNQNQKDARTLAALVDQPTSAVNRLLNFVRGTTVEAGGDAPRLKRGYDQIRSYDTKPFDLDREFRGSVEFINRLLPPGKRVEVLQWSGDTTPFAQAIAASRSAGIRNLNGGDSRFDPEYPSYAWVAPVGRQAGDQRQIYASNSNENNYTDRWTDRFFGFRYLVGTIQNTETPLRVKAMNVYFHMYSGEKLPSLTALIENLDFVSRQEIAPIPASNYAGIADGFYETRFIALGRQSWRIEDRDQLQTIRFDNARSREIDFARSIGVIGQRRYGDSLYAALDAAVSTPVITLKPVSTRGTVPSAVPYLIHARWQIWGLQRQAGGFSFTSQGFGPGEILWKVPGKGLFEVTASSSAGKTWNQSATVSTEGVLNLTVPSTSHDKWTVSVRPITVTP